jgi:hypothetical protein
VVAASASLRVLSKTPSSRKHVLTAACVVAVFTIEFIHPGSAKNLEIIIPALVASYCAANVYDKKVNRDDTK